jgi:hypothetical protein
MFALSFSHGRIPPAFQKIRESMRNQRWSDATDHVTCGMSPAKWEFVQAPLR